MHYKLYRPHSSEEEEEEEEMSDLCPPVVIGRCVAVTGVVPAMMKKTMMV